MHEQDDFQPQFSVREGVPDSRSDSGVLLKENEGLLRVQLVVTPFGMPRRWRRPPAVRLAPGEWLRWQINYRFSGSRTEWTYRLDTLNVAYGTPAVGLFLDEPTRYVNELASLR